MKKDNLVNLRLEKLLGVVALFVAITLFCFTGCAMSDKDNNVKPNVIYIHDTLPFAVIDTLRLPSKTRVEYDTITNIVEISHDADTVLIKTYHADTIRTLVETNVYNDTILNTYTTSYLEFKIQGELKAFQFRNELNNAAIQSLCIVQRPPCPKEQPQEKINLFCKLLKKIFR